jgi:acetoin utilization deacetylase AcuC-like enzyme
MRPIPVFYSPKQTAPHNVSYSPSAQKPARVVEAWLQTGIPLNIIEPEPATIDELARAHDREYVRAVLDGRVSNGFGNTLAEVNATLPWTSGSLRSAVLQSARTGESTFSPTSGFHHASYADGGGFCTFNGLMVAAFALRAGEPATRVAIIDCDRHYGNGTDDIIARTNAGSWIAHYTLGAHPVTPANAEQWLKELPGIVQKTVEGCAVAIYQAGADAHIDDPLGGILTSDQMAERDRIVFSECARSGVPVVTNLAGGYQKPVDKVVALHVQTLREFVAATSSALR